MQLTERQQLCLAVIESSIRVQGRSPTYLEIGVAMDLRQRQVERCLSDLYRKQVITMQAGELHVLKPSEAALKTISFARSDSDWIGDVAIVAARYGFVGAPESLPGWLDHQLSKGST